MLSVWAWNAVSTCQFYDIIHIDEDHGSMLKLYQFEIENSDDGLEYQAKSRQKLPPM